MGTDYKVIEGKHVELSIIEHSSAFDVTFFIKETGTIDIAMDLTAESLAEVGLRFIQAALYNVGDVDAFRKWLHVRVNEVDSSGTRTAYIEDR